MKDRKRKNSKHANLKLFLFALLMTFVICRLIILSNEYLPEDSRFDARIWGTVNDWMVYGVALITAVFLYQTLQSQMEVQKMQQKLMEIEDFRISKELQPRFEIKGEAPIYEDNHVLTRYNVIVRDNDAQNIRMECNSESSSGYIKNTWNQKVLNRDNTMDFHHEIPIERGKIHFEIRIYIIFEDIRGNRYSQYAEIIKPDGPTRSYGQRPGPTPLTEEA